MKCWPLSRKSLHCCAAGSGLVGAAVVSNPCCLNRSSVALETPWRMSMVYNLVIAARLRQARTAGNLVLASQRCAASEANACRSQLGRTKLVDSIGA